MTRHTKGSAASGAQVSPNSDQVPIQRGQCAVDAKVLKKIARLHLSGTPDTMDLLFAYHTCLGHTISCRSRDDSDE